MTTTNTTNTAEDLIAQRDELAAALRDLLEGMSRNCSVPLVQFGGDPTYVARAMNRARAALAKVQA